MDAATEAREREYTQDQAIRHNLAFIRRCYSVMADPCPEPRLAHYADPFELRRRQLFLAGLRVRMLHRDAQFQERLPGGDWLDSNPSRAHLYASRFIDMLPKDSTAPEHLRLLRFPQEIFWVVTRISLRALYGSRHIKNERAVRACIDEIIDSFAIPPNLMLKLDEAYVASAPDRHLDTDFSYLNMSSAFNNCIGVRTATVRGLYEHPNREHLFKAYPELAIEADDMLQRYGFGFSVRDECVCAPGNEWLG